MPALINVVSVRFWADKKKIQNISSVYKMCSFFLLTYSVSLQMYVNNFDIIHSSSRTHGQYNKFTYFISHETDRERRGDDGKTFVRNKKCVSVKRSADAAARASHNLLQTPCGGQHIRTRCSGIISYFNWTVVYFLVAAGICWIRRDELEIEKNP